MGSGGVLMGMIEKGEGEKRRLYNKGKYNEGERV